jgi:hypothetical protein
MPIVTRVPPDGRDDETAVPKRSTRRAPESATLIGLIKSTSRVVNATYPVSFRTPLVDPEVLRKLDPDLQNRWRQLTAEGVDFLYGMLFFAAFEISPSVRRSLGGPVVPLSLAYPTDGDGYDDDNGTALALHAIAIDARNWEDSADQASAADCLASAVESMSSSSCQLFVLADGTISNQEQALAQIVTFVDESSTLGNCEVSTPPLVLPEPGSDGASFLESASAKEVESWLFVARVAWMSSRIRWAYVGPPGNSDPKESRSNPSLLLQAIQYRRRSEIWHQGRDPPVLPRELSVCAWQS